MSLVDPYDWEYNPAEFYDCMTLGNSLEAEVTAERLADVWHMIKNR